MVGKLVSRMGHIGVRSFRIALIEIESPHMSVVFAYPMAPQLKEQMPRFCSVVSSDFEIAAFENGVGLPVRVSFDTRGYESARRRVKTCADAAQGYRLNAEASRLFPGLGHMVNKRVGDSRLLIDRRAVL